MTFAASRTTISGPRGQLRIPARSVQPNPTDVLDLHISTNSELALAARRGRG